MTSRKGKLSTSRLDGFSDGVFAIAITLLVLELDAPEGGDHLLRLLLAEWPSFAGYLVSFAFIGSVWISHSSLSSFLRSADEIVVGLNLLLLFAVSLLPFTTKLMAANIMDSGEHFAVVIFGLNLLLASVMLSAMIRHAAVTEDLTHPETAHELDAFARRRRPGIIVLILSICASLITPYLALVGYLLISLYMLIQPVTRAYVVHRRTASSDAHAMHDGADGAPQG